MKGISMFKIKEILRLKCEAKLSKYSVNPEFMPIEVENYIFSTAVDLGSDDDNLYGHGRIDAEAAVVSAIDSSGAPNISAIIMYLLN